MEKRLLVLATCLFMMIGIISAQTTTVSGTVISGDDHEPVVGASVMVKGSSIGTTTDLDGKFLLKDVPTNGTLVVAFVGMSTQELPVAPTVNVVLRSSVELEEVVVTAMGISKSEKSLGYSATQVSAADIEQAQSSNVMSSLAGKVAGLQIQTVSASPGSASNVTIRGISSINGNNQPLYVVDGIPMSNSSFIGQGNQMATGGIANISPDDVASVTVLKGAAATALYGSRAANGVIMITTKSGKSGVDKNYTVTYSGNISARRVAMLPEMQNEWGQGWNGTQTYIENGSWGPHLDGSTQVYGPIWNYEQRAHIYDAKKNNVKDFFDTGWSQNHSVALSGVSKSGVMSYYFSYNYTGDNGMMPGKADTYDRNTFSFRGSYQPEKWMKITTSVNYATFNTKVVGSYQGTSVIDGLYEMPRDISIVDMKDLSSPFNTPEAYYTPYGITNPYWAIANNKYSIAGKQMFGKVQFDIFPIQDVTLTYRFGFDSSDSDTKLGFPQISLTDDLIIEDYGYAPSNMNQDGYVYANYNRRHEINHDFLAMYNKKFFDDRFDVTATAGATVNERYATALVGETDILSINTGFWDLSNGSTKTTLAESQSKRRSAGVFADVTLGWDDFVFLDVTARNDWSSTLPQGHNSYFYPGVTLSGIFTKWIQNKDVLSFGKVRLAYGKTGNDADPYRTNTSYIQASTNGYYGNNILQFPIAGINSFMASSQLGSPTLKPEMTTEFEAGLDLKLFNGRIGIDAAYYDRTTKDQIFTLPIDPASGYSTMVTNFGEVRNRGVELMVNFIPVQLRNFQWEIGFNFAKNSNKVVSVPESLEDGKLTLYNFSAGNDAVYMYAEQGKPLGTYWTYLPLYVTDESSPYYGCPIVDSHGQPVLSDDIMDTGWNMNHKWIGGATTSISAYGVTLSAALDVRYGGMMFSRTKNLMQFTGNGTVTTYNDRRPFVVPNSVVDNGDGTYSENTTPIYLSDSSYQDYFNNYGWGNGGTAYLVNRSYVKLRNISLTWDLPKKWMRAVYLSGVSVTAYANNLFTWTAKDNIYVDPESSTTASSSSSLGVMFGETYTNPSAKEFGVNLKVNF